MSTASVMYSHGGQSGVAADFSGNLGANSQKSSSVFSLYSSSHKCTIKLKFVD